jgi:F-type H+-transporting ATPase subunit gamma
LPSLRDIRKRIKSVESTKQITKAMEMVSAAKLRRSQTRVEAARPYGLKMQQMLESLAGAASNLHHPIFEERPIKTSLLVVITSDRGMCGSYNSNVLRTAFQYTRERSVDTVKLGLIGKKSVNAFKKKPYPIAFTLPSLGGSAELSVVRTLANDITNMYEQGVVDEVNLLYTRFITVSSNKLMLERFLPIESPAGKDDERPSEYIFEPGPQEIFANLVPRYCLTKILMALLESFASEFAARMIAMGNATRNADEMIDNLTLVRNQVRQSAITTELLDIVGGAEALK